MKRVSRFIIAVMLVLPCVTMSGKQTKVLKIDFNNPVQERIVSGVSSINVMSLLDGMSSPVTMLSYVQAIDAAAQDKNIGMIYMTPDNISAGVAQVEEIRAALERFRKTGKPVVAYCRKLGTQSYYLASVADKVVLDPASESFITGISSMHFFLKDILDVLHVDMQLIRHGKYKAAGEMYTRSSSSPENRQQNEELLGAMWKSMSAQVVASRNFSADDLNGWIDNLDLCTAQDFKDKGLVDETWYIDEMEKYLCEQSGAEKIEDVSFVKINKYASKLKKGSRKNRIAIIYADGDIVDDGSDANVVGPKLASVIRKVREDKKVKAVVLRVNSPGGSAQAAEAIRRELQLLRAQKPVIMSLGDYAASGGYWISAESDQIFIDNATVTGSIGVFALIPNLGDVAGKVLKVNVETTNTSAHSDMMTVMRKLSDEEVAFIEKQIEKVYDDFTSIVSNGRGMKKDEVDAIGQGRVWSGLDALSIGLADRNGGLQDAIAYAAEKAGLDKDDYRLDLYPEVKEVSLLQMLSGKEIEDPDELLTTSVGSQISLEDLFPVLARLRELDNIMIMARMESIIEIR
ncbi:MAG: signal peptide peptidase SppA [Bacteroidaceae bacterium]|nr:signal peptide peptidase SppA [Bacteroidaceae bacterium]